MPRHILLLIPLDKSASGLLKMALTPAGRMLTRQLQQMQSDKDIPGISCGLVSNNIFEWEVMLMISDDCKFYGGKELYLGWVAAVPHLFLR